MVVRVIIYVGLYYEGGIKINRKGEPKMNTDQIVEKLVSHFESSGKSPLIHCESDGDCAHLSVLFPWRYDGKISQISSSFFVNDKGIIASISVCEDHSVDDVYVGGPSADSAYTSVIQWLWRYFSVNACEKHD